MKHADWGIESERAGPGILSSEKIGNAARQKNWRRGIGGGGRLATELAAAERRRKRPNDLYNQAIAASASTCGLFNQDKAEIHIAHQFNTSAGELAAELDAVEVRMAKIKVELQERPAMREVEAQVRSAQTAFHAAQAELAGSSKANTKAQRTLLKPEIARVSAVFEALQCAVDRQAQAVKELKSKQTAAAASLG